MKSHSEGGLLTMEHYCLIDNGYWDIKDLSRYLKVRIKTLYAMVPDIPHYRIGKLIRFRKQEIDSWMERNRNMVFDRGGKSGNPKGGLSGKTNTDIDRLIRKAIDQSKQETYNCRHGKSDQIEGPTKEKNHGSV
jgi:excisionase family DNA binding protein